MLNSIRHDHSSVAAYQNMIDQFKMIGNLLPIIFINICVSVAVNLYFYFKIRKLDMVDTLKVLE